MRISDWSSDVCSSDLKIEDEDSGRIYPTNVACKLLDRHSAQCMDYRRRKAFVPDCLRLTLRLLDDIEWLPESCAYKLRAADKSLPEWHYLICGDREAVHRAGQSIRGWTISETEAGDLENHVRSEEHTSELQSLMRISYAVFCLKKNTK